MKKMNMPLPGAYTKSILFFSLKTPLPL